MKELTAALLFDGKGKLSESPQRGKDDLPASGAIFVTEPGVRGAVSPDPRGIA